MRNVLIVLSMIALLSSLAGVNAHEGEELEEAVLTAATYINGLNITTQYDNFVKPLLPFTGELLIVNANQSVKATIMPDYRVRVNDNRNANVLVKISEQDYDMLYEAVMNTSNTADDLIQKFNSANVTVVPKSTKAEIGISLVKKYSPLQFNVEKEQGIVPAIRSAISSIITTVIGLFAGLLGFK